GQLWACASILRIFCGAGFQPAMGVGAAGWKPAPQSENGSLRRHFWDGWTSRLNGSPPSPPTKWDGRSMDSPRSSSRALQALRVAAAASIALVVAEWWHLPHANLAVWTTHMIMSSHRHTTFQKGFERIVGRGAGILVGTLIVSLFGEQKLLALGLES